MLILLEYYQKYIKEGLNPTPEVMKATDNVRDEDDPYITYIDNNFERTTNDYDRISQPEINRMCGKWFTENIKNVKFKKKSIKEAFEKYHGKISEGIKINNVSTDGWCYVKLRNSL